MGKGSLVVSIHLQEVSDCVAWQRKGMYQPCIDSLAFFMSEVPPPPPPSPPSPPLPPSSPSPPPPAG